MRNNMIQLRKQSAKELVRLNFFRLNFFGLNFCQLSFPTGRSSRKTLFFRLDLPVEKLSRKSFTRDF